MYAAQIRLDRLLVIGRRAVLEHRINGAGAERDLVPQANQHLHAGSGADGSEIDNGNSGMLGECYFSVIIVAFKGLVCVVVLVGCDSIGNA